MPAKHSVKLKLPVTPDKIQCPRLAKKSIPTQYCVRIDGEQIPLSHNPAWVARNAVGIAIARALHVGYTDVVSGIVHLGGTERSCIAKDTAGVERYLKENPNEGLWVQATSSKGQLCGSIYIIRAKALKKDAVENPGFSALMEKAEDDERLVSSVLESMGMMTTLKTYAQLRKANKSLEALPE